MRRAEVARRIGVPVLQMVGLGWRNEAELGLWTAKLPPCAEITPYSRLAEVDERLWDDSDVLLPEKWPSFFHGTPPISLLTAQQRDTVIVTGCTTSGCVRATVSRCLLLRLPHDPLRRTASATRGATRTKSNLRDVHRRYAEVTESDQAISYLELLPQAVSA